MKIYKLPIIFAVLSSSAFADWGYINVRTEYRQDERVSYDRLMLGYGFDNGFGLHTEVQFKSKDGKNKNVNPETGGTRKPANRDRALDFVNNGHGFILDYNFGKIPGWESWTFKPSLSLYSGTGYSTWEPAMEIYYRFNPEWRLRTRIRADINRSPYVGGSTSTTFRPEFWVDYNLPDTPWSFTYNFIYYHSDKQTLWNDEQYNYAQDIAIKYRIGNWTPAFQIGDIKGADKYDDRRQIRYRLGFTYSF